MDEVGQDDVAIIGVAGHFPGAPSADELWQAVANAEDCLQDLSTQGAIEAGASPEMANDPDYVRRGGTLADVEFFDPDFFGIGRRDAAIMDPQHRHFIECVWEALESAAHTPESFDGPIGLFAGCGMNTYLLNNLLTNPQLVDQLGWFLMRHTANDKDFLTTTASYHLGLEGPSVNVQTACSTSLVAVHLAIQSLLGFECDLALAGGSTIEFPHGVGYLYRPGEILAPDGVCRAYDANSGGTVLTSGAAVVALRRLEDALEDGDPVLAVIKGSAINNDGRRKVSYLAPSVDGHADVVREALSVADVDASSIQLVEGHGTGTALGDPIEVAALTEAFRAETTDTGFCRLVSTKPNIGHLDTAAGTASLIKVVQALRHQTLPPLANHTGPSEMANIDGSPFVLSGEAAPWESDGPRRAGVSSLGVGGTNAHVIVEEAPDLEPEAPGTGPVALLLSGRTRKAVDQVCERLADHLEANPGIDLHAVANTLATGRRHMQTRRVVMAENRADAIEQLRTKDRATSHTATAPEESTGTPSVVFMFPGGGAQYLGMGAGLGEEFSAYHETMRYGIDCVRAMGGPDLDQLMAIDADPDEAQRTTAALPAVFLTSVALARQWMAWGVEPAAMLGHSLGEYAAAHLAGVLSLDDALKLVVVRSRLMEQATGRGTAAMLVVPLPESELSALLTEPLSLATVNAADECVVAGPTDAVEALAADLEASGLEPTRIPLLAAAHSSMLDPILDDFAETTRSITLKPPTMRYMSNLTGTWITDEQATDPAYWVQHLRHTVRFNDGLQTILAEGPTVLVELGPGHSLSSYARRSDVAPVDAIASLRHPNHDCADATFTRLAFARQWICDVEVDLDTWTGAGRRRLRLPTYPFQRERCWIEPGTGSAIGTSNADGDTATPQGPNRIDSIDDMFWTPTWNEADELIPTTEPTNWFIIGTGTTAEQVAAALRARGNVATVAADLSSFAPDTHRHVLITAPNEPGLTAAAKRWVHLGADAAKALALSAEPATIVALTSGALSARGQATAPLDALALGVTGSGPKEYPNIAGRVVDLDPHRALAEQVDTVVDELTAGHEPVVAHRSQTRLLPGQTRTTIEDAEASAFKTGGTYLITGGLGGIGFELAKYLAGTYAANLVLTSSRALPDTSEREQWLSSHGANDPTSLRLRRLAELEAMTKVAVVVVDLERGSDLSEALDSAERLVGAIDGAVHAAGTVRDRLIEMADTADHDYVLGAKVQGALGLIDVLHRRDVGLLVLISSTSTILKPEGQTSYVAANSVLDSLAGSHGTLKVSTLNYGVWADTGLAADLARRARLGFDTGERLAHPVFEELLVDHNGAHSVIGTLDTKHHWVVDEHRTESGLAVLPGTGQLDLMLTAVEMAGLSEQGLGAVALLEPLVVSDDDPVTVRVVISPEPEASSTNRSIRLESDGGGQQWRVHGEAELRPFSTAPPALDLQSLADRIRIDEFDPLQGQRRHLQLGARWDAIDNARLGDGESIATLELQDPAEAELWAAHPALVDVGTALGVALGGNAEHLLHVPIGYDEVRSHGRLGSRCIAYAQRRSASTPDVLLVDLTMTDLDGRALLEIQGLQLRPLSEPAALGKPPESTSSTPDRPSLFQLAASLGIKGAEGAAMLERAATGDAQRLIGSSIDLDYLLSPPTLPEATAPAPDAGVPAAATADDAIHAIWVELLGVPEIEPDDDFFDLGGHSLIAIRLMTQIQRQLGVRFQLATIFEAPTVASLAELVRAERPDIDAILSEAAAGKPDPLPEAAVMAPDTPAPALKSLVTISSKGEGQPLFVVHGAGGNILFLSSLARAMPGRRPLYGFQAHGVDGEDLPDGSIEEMADRYVEELLASHEGPYLLGGYSGGGQVALEMASRLLAQGREVTAVVLFDSVPAGKAMPSAMDQWRNLSSHAVRRGLLSIKPYMRKRAIEMVGPYVPRRRAARLELAGQDARDLGYQDMGQHGFVNLFYYFSATANRHETGIYDVDVIVLQADLQWPVQPADYYWKKHITGKRIYRHVPGDHNTMFFAENAPALAEGLSSALQELNIN